MTRAFLPAAVASATVDQLLDVARRAPSAGNTASAEFLVLEGPTQVAQYWDTTLPIERRSAFPWPNLLQAPVLIVVWVDPSAYVARYAEEDKGQPGLGDSIEGWPVPYWFVDGGAVVMSLILGAEAEGLGALFFGLFEHEDSVRSRFGVPDTHRAVGTIAIGHAADERSSRSAHRSRAPLSDVVHRGCWSGLV